MKITLESTSNIVTLVTDDGNNKVPARIWRGTTESGIPVECFITRVAVPSEQPDHVHEQFRTELTEQRAPRADPTFGAWPLRMIL